MLAPNRFGALWLALLATAALPAASFGIVTGFTGITNNNAASTAAGETQLWVDITSPQANQVLFTFGNTGTAQSTITQIYFEQGPLSDLLQIINSGTAFQETGPGVLPGGNGQPVSFQTMFEADANNPRPKNGVNNGPAVGGDTVGLLFSLASQKTYQDVLNQLDDGQLRIGLHVQNFANGYSESFIDQPPGQPPQTPEPTTGAIALAALAFLRVRRRQATL